RDDIRGLDHRRTETQSHRARHCAIAPTGKAMRLLEEEDLLAPAFERHDVGLEQVEHGAAEQSARSDALRQLHLHQEILAKALARDRDPHLAILLVRVEEAWPMFGVA